MSDWSKEGTPDRRAEEYRCSALDAIAEGEHGRAIAQALIALEARLEAVQAEIAEIAQRVG